MPDFGTADPRADDLQLRPFAGCHRCLDTGWAFMPHSDEAREVCDCPMGERVREGLSRPRGIQ